MFDLFGIQFNNKGKESLWLLILVWKHKLVFEQQKNFGTKNEYPIWGSSSDTSLEMIFVIIFISFIIGNWQSWVYYSLISFINKKYFKVVTTIYLIFIIILYSSNVSVIIQTSNDVRISFNIISYQTYSKCNLYLAHRQISLVSKYSQGKKEQPELHKKFSHTLNNCMGEKKHFVNLELNSLQ